MELITAIKNGDSLAYESVFFNFKEKVLAYFIGRTGSLHDAEDLLQDTFLRLWRYRKKLNEDYLIEQQIFFFAKSAYIDYLRRNSKVKKIEVAVSEKPDSTNAEEIFFKQEIDRLLEALPEFQKKILVMHKVEGYSYKEIAEKLNLTMKSVDNNLSRSLRQLRKIVSSIFFF